MFSTNFFSTASHTSNTGEMPKCWCDNQILYKFDKTSITFEVYSEVVCSRIADLLNIDHVEYTLGEINGKEACCCKTFLSAGECLVTPSDMVLYSNYTRAEALDYVCQLNPLLYSQMLLFDFLVLNTDRHFGNLGCIRGNVERMAPLFDHDAALYSSRLNDSGSPYDTVDLWCSERLYSSGVGMLLSRAADMLQITAFGDVMNMQALRTNIDEVFYGLPRFSRERISSLKMLICNRLRYLEEYNGGVL